MSHRVDKWLTSVAAQSRGDDLEALGYMMLYFMFGSLPWQGLKAPTWEQNNQLVLEKKETTSVAELCGDLPQEFGMYMNYVRNLRQEDKPDYGYLRRIFRKLFRQQRFEYDQVFDWTILEYQRQSVESAEQSPATRNAERMRGEERGEYLEDQSKNVAKRRRRKGTRRRTSWSDVN